MHTQALVDIDGIKMNFHSCAETENLKIFGVALAALPNHSTYNELITFEQAASTENKTAIILKPNGGIFDADVDDLTGIRICSMVTVVV